MSGAEGDNSDPLRAYWDGQYRAGARLWGDAPSELATVAVDRLREVGPGVSAMTLLDIGCGYGRDAVALWRELGLSIVASDGAARAIEMARAALPEGARIEYRVAGFAALGEARHDVVYASNLYQLLDPPARARFRVAVRGHVAPGGLVFISTLSVADPQHYGRGDPVPGDADSFVERTYLHFCRREELARDFAFLEIERLDEIVYHEERPGSPAHDHVSWVLIGRSPSAGR